MKNLIKKLTCCVYPEKCINCGAFCESGNICSKCSPLFEPITKPTCDLCGLTKENCECKKSIYRFKGIAAPFINENAAQTALYNFKFNGYISAADFFASYMVQTAKLKFKNITFDYCFAIPMSKISELARGYNQAELLAERVAKALEIKYIKRALIKTKNTSTQHELTKEERFSNLIGAYKLKPNINVKGKTVLLVDDIKTTGATLDEATKVLLIKGAKAVYCLCAAITEKNN